MLARLRSCSLVRECFLTTPLSNSFDVQEMAIRAQHHTKTVLHLSRVRQPIWLFALMEHASRHKFVA